MKVVKRIPIRYAETDQMGVVYHGNYLLYLEDARTAFLEALEYPYRLIEEAGYLSPVTSLQIDYGSPLRYGGEAVVVVWISQSGPVKTTYSYEIYSDVQTIGKDAPCCTASSVHCLVDASTFKPVSTKRATPKLYALYQDVVEPSA